MKSLNRWIYAIIGVISLLMAGTIYSWSVMMKTIEAARPNWAHDKVSMTFTLVMAFFCIGSLIAGILSKKVKSKIYVMIGAICLGLGLFIASMTQDSLITLYLGFGILCGLGSGFTYNAVMGTICAWFPDKQGLISGILLMGFGLSSFIIGKVFAFIAPPDGSDAWCGLYRGMAIIWFVILIICSFFFVKPGADFAPPAPKKQKVVREPALDVNTGTMIKMPTFWMTYIWAIMVSAAGLALMGQASGIATQVGPGVSAGTIATVVGLISVVNGVGRIIYGGMFDKIGYKTTMIIEMAFFIITGLILMAAIASGSFALVVIGFVCGGFAYAGVTPIQSAIISDFYGRTNYSTNFSVIVTNLLIGSFASTISAKLYVASGSFNSTCIMIIGVTVVAFVVFFLIRRPKSK